MTAFLVLAAVLAFALNAALTRMVQIRFPGRQGILRCYQALFALTAALAFGVSYLLQTESLSVTSNELSFGILFGVFYFIAVAGSAAGYELGSMSLTAIIVNMSLLIPLLYSCVIQKEAAEPLQIVGIALIALTMILAVDRDRKKKKGGRPVKWLLVVLLAFFANGITAVLQKEYILSSGEEGTMLFMSVAYLTAALLFLGNAAWIRSRKQERLLEKPLSLTSMSILSGLGSFGGNALLGILCVRISGAVLYPFLNGGLCIVSAALSFVLFREKATLRKLIAIGVGLVAIVLLNL